MIERSTLAELAATRRLADFRFHGIDGTSAGNAVVLWPAPPAMVATTGRDDLWHALAFDVGGTVRPVLLAAREDEHVRTLDNVYPPIDLAAPIAAGDYARMIEAGLLAARDGLRLSFRYRKVGGGAIEERRGTARSVVAGLLRIDDSDRGGAVRGYRLDGIDALRILDGVPRWDGRGYVLPEVA